MISYGIADRHGRPISCRPVGPDNWRAVADVAPRDDQREFVAALAARYLLVSMLGDDWTSLGVYAGEAVVGHVIWGSTTTARTGSVVWSSPSAESDREPRHRLTTDQCHGRRCSTSGSTAVAPASRR